MMLIVATTGGGKSVAIQSTAYELMQHGYTIIYLTEKERKELENAFWCFPVKEEYQKRIMRMRGIEPLDPEYQKDIVRIYHPITTSIPRKMLPPMQLYSFSVKRLSESAVNVILGGTQDKETVNIALRALNDLSSDDTLWDFVWQVNEKVSGNTNLFSKDPKGMFLPVKTKGDIRSVQSIRDAVSDFRDDYMIHHDKSQYNISMIDILNDNTHVHFFTTKYIRKERVKYFSMVQLIQEIDLALASGKVKHPLLLINEEVKVLMPRSVLTTYQQELINKTVKMLSTWRSAGKGVFIISSTQNFFQINEGFRDSNRDVLLGELSYGDKARLIEIQKIGSMNMELLNGLRIGQFVWWRQMEQEAAGRKISIHPPPFAIAEQDDSFEKLWHQHYPDRMVSYSEELDRIISMRREIEEKARKRLERTEEKEIKAMEEKVKEKEQKKAAALPSPSLVAAEKKVTKAQKIEMCYRLKKEKPKMLWREVGLRAGVSEPTAQKYVLIYAKQMRDDELIKALNWSIE